MQAISGPPGDMMRAPTFDYLPGPSIGVAHLMGESVDLLNALAGLAQCFDADGVYHIAPDIGDRLRDARDVVRRAVPDDAWDEASCCFPEA